MLDFVFRDSSVPFGALSNPVKNLLFTILVKSTLLSSIPGRLQGMLECKFQRTLSPIGILSEEFANGEWDTRFGEALQEDFER
jgi:hypothetical protein